MSVTRGLGSLFLTGVAFSLGAVLLSEPASAHMNIVGLEHFAQNKALFVGVVTRAQDPTAMGGVPLAVFELGAGRRVAIYPVAEASQLRVSEGRDDATVPFHVDPGELLAFVETNDTFDGRAIIKGSGRLKGLYAINPKTHRDLVANPHNLVYAVPLRMDQADSEISGSRVTQAQDAARGRGVPSPKVFNHRLRAAVAAGSDRSNPIVRQRLLDDLWILAGEKPFADQEAGGEMRTIGERGSTEGRDLTRSFLLQSFRAAGADADLWCYKGSRMGCNVMATQLRPEAKATLVVTSHMDSVRNKGADDNASGTAALLELARVFADDPVPLNLMYIAFDQEEIGLIGSARMAKEMSQLVPGRFLGNVNTDMIGYDADGDGALHLIDCGRQDSQWLTETARAAIAAWKLPLIVKPDCTNRSDHASFWSQGLPAMLVSENFFGGDSNRCYHKACDKVDLINQNYYVNLVAVLHGTVRLAAEALE